jgi:hypothetical protein
MSVETRTATATLRGIAPYSQSRKVQTERPSAEPHGDFERRTWKERLHVSGGSVIIPPMAFKNALSEAAKFAGIKVPSKRGATYTKHFEAGVMVVQPLVLGISPDDVVGEWLFVPSDGRRGGKSRVDRCFPRIDAWGGAVEFHVLDQTISKQAFEEHLDIAGNMIGIGRFRPRNNGYYGRFVVESVEWE